MPLQTEMSLTSRELPPRLLQVAVLARLVRTAGTTLEQGEMEGCKEKEGIPAKKVKTACKYLEKHQIYLSKKGQDGAELCIL